MTNRTFSKLGLKFIMGTLIPALVVLILTGVVCVVVLHQNKMGSIRQGVYEQAERSDRVICNTLESSQDILDLKEGHNILYNYIMNYDNDPKRYYYNKAIGILDSFSDNSIKDSICSSWLAVFDKSVIYSDSINNTVVDDIKDFTERPWYDAEKLKKGEVYNSNVYESVISDKYFNNRVVSIVCPILNWRDGNKVIGACGVEISMNYLNEFFKVRGFKDTVIMVCDDEYNLNYCKAAIFDKKYREFERLVKDVRESTSEEVNYNGKKYMVLDTAYNGCGWNVLYLINYKEIYASLNSVIVPIVMIILISCFVIGFIMITYIARFVARINLMTSNTLGIIKGVYDNKMSIESDDEFGQLAKAYNETIDHLKYLAEFDQTTGVYNLSTFYTKAVDFLQTNEDLDNKCAIVRLDIDHFRVINDIYNWQVGNNVLKHIADCIKEYISKEDGIVGRMSADMFVICMRYYSVSELEKTLMQIKDKIVEYDIVVNINPHFGIYLDAEKELPIYLMCDRAGIALGIIKGNLLTTFSYYDMAVNRMNMDIKFIETSTQQAFAEKQFYIQLQPKFDMRTGTIVGAEALVRWKHPVKGLIRPDSFIPIFEKNGNIIRLDEYVWEETCRCIRKWLNMGLNVLPISVNVSRVHIYNKHLVEELCALVEKYNIPVELLQLEFTESALLDDTKELYEMMNRLKEKNFTLLMDDFASGYSSLNTLKSAPFDIVKLDKEFISAVAESKRDRMLVESTISMIDKQSMNIVVEGVETIEQVGILVESGCNVAQGYYFSKPVDVNVYEKMAFGIE